MNVVDDELDLDQLDLENVNLEGRFGEYGALQALGEAGEAAIETLESLLSPWDLLAPYRVPVTPTEALTCLETILEPIRLLALYKHYFPEEFAKSKAEMLPREYAYSDAEIEFLRLVDERLFPIWEHVIMWHMDEGERDTVIPCAPQAMEVYNRELEDFESGWHLLFILERFVRLDDLPDGSPCQEWVDDLWEYLTWLPERYIGPFTFEQLDALGHTLEGPLKHLPMAVRMLHEGTGNAWLDITQEMAAQDRSVHWSRDWVDALAEEWGEAKEIQTQVNELIEWLEEDRTNQRQLFDLYRQGLDDLLAARAEETERIRVRT